MDRLQQLFRHQAPALSALEKHTATVNHDLINIHARIGVLGLLMRHMQRDDRLNDEGKDGVGNGSNPF